VKYHELLLYFNRLKVVLNSCELQCVSEGCNFHCLGTDFNSFYHHVTSCKYQRVQCRHCSQFVLQRNLVRHEQDRCRHKRIPCDNESCKILFSLNEIKAHKRVCPFQEVVCPNNGCTHVFAKKDRNKHMEICDYVHIFCVGCSTWYFRIDAYTHKCRNALPNHLHPSECFRQTSVTERPETFRCNHSGCNFSGVYNALTDHDKTCEYKIHQCSNCGTRMPKRQLTWHSKECDTLVECETCCMQIPRLVFPAQYLYEFRIFISFLGGD